MKCPYCDTEFELEALQAAQEEEEQPKDSFNWKKEEESQWGQGETDGLRTYSCKSCGAEIVSDATLGSTKCPYCDNPIVMTGQFSGDLKPDYVIPFKLDKKAAKIKLKEHMSGKKLLPKVFSDENHIDEIKGVYVPFWLFDTEADARIRYSATKTRLWEDANYKYTQTSFYSVVRGGGIGFEHIPVDGTSKIADDLLESVEPFNIKEAVPFNSAYLAGYLADRYDIDADASIDRANQRVKQSAADAFRKTVTGYETVNAESTSIQLRNGTIKYALYPVWILNTKWNGQKYTFAMNGQTGKFVGDLPEDKSLASKIRMTTAAGIFAVCFGISVILSFIL